jgi:hypothetical protein
MEGTAERGRKGTSVGKKEGEDGVEGDAEGRKAERLCSLPGRRERRQREPHQWRKG